MDEKLVKKLRGKLSGLATAAAVFAIIGAVGIFVIKGLVISEVIKVSSLASDPGVGTILFYSAVILLWDITRLGGFGMFVCGVLAVVTELVGGVRGKAYAFVMLAGSVCGLVAAIRFSVQNIFRSLFMVSIQSSIYGNGIGASSTAFIDFPCIMAIISSVMVFVAAGIRSAGANRVYVQQPPQYPQQESLQYPQTPSMPYADPIIRETTTDPYDNNTPKDI